MHWSTAMLPPHATHPCGSSSVELLDAPNPSMAKHRADSLAWFATHLDEMLVELINALVLILRPPICVPCLLLLFFGGGYLLGERHFQCVYYRRTDTRGPYWSDDVWELNISFILLSERATLLLGEGWILWWRLCCFNYSANTDTWYDTDTDTRNNWRVRIAWIH